MARLTIFFIEFSVLFHVFLAVNIGKEKKKDPVTVTILDGAAWKWTRNPNINLTTSTVIPPTTKPLKYHLKPGTRKSLRKALRGTTPEKRKRQLAQMGKRMKIEKISKSQSENLHKSYRKVNVTKNPPALDMFEVNEISGLNDYLFQGDINLDEFQIAEFSSKASSRQKRQVRNSAKFWTDKTVNYYFDSGLNTSIHQVVLDATKFLEERTCIRFILNSTATNRVRVFNGDGCYSNVGMLGGEQSLSLGTGCGTVGIAAHEFTHTLGVLHTQMRSDRDDYVTIDLTDVPEDSQSNFYKMAESGSTNYVDYEYGSFMHYTGKAFVPSGGVDSIVPKEPLMVYTMGGRIITFLDIKMLNIHYSCSCPAPLACQNGGYANPANCTQCLCPYGFGGILCNERPDYGCGSELLATNTWQQNNYTFGNVSNSATARPYFVYCTHWIKAPAGKQIQFRIDAGYNTQCTYGCVFNGIEPKLKNDMVKTQARYCCPEFYNEIMLSDVNPLPVFSYNRFYITKYSWSYRYVDDTPACVNVIDTTTCLALKAAKEQGCNLYDDAQLKVMCAVTMNMCGKRAETSCADRFTADQCSTYLTNGMCASQLPLIAEFSCASTCGFCINPV